LLTFRNPIMPNHEEAISRLMDGELGDSREVGRLLDRINADSEARDAWARYHLARQLLRDEQNPLAFDVQFAERVSQSLESEPHWLLPARRRALRETPVVRWAVAASLAAMAVLATYRFQFAGGASGSGPSALAVSTEPGREAELHAEAEERLRAYMALHNESIQVIRDDDGYSSRSRPVSYTP
jgi:sigma-E factor negative regulatory protein RseA